MDPGLRKTFATRDEALKYIGNNLDGRATLKVTRETTLTCEGCLDETRMRRERIRIKKSVGETYLFYCCHCKTCFSMGWGSNEHMFGCTSCKHTPFQTIETFEVIYKE